MLWYVNAGFTIVAFAAGTPGLASNPAASKAPESDLEPESAGLVPEPESDVELEQRTV
jgi:hypothetical protein